MDKRETFEYEDAFEGDEDAIYAAVGDGEQTRGYTDDPNLNIEDIPAIEQHIEMSPHSDAPEFAETHVPLTTNIHAQEAVALQSLQQSMSHELKAMQQQLSSISSEENLIKQEHQRGRSEGGCFCSYSKIICVITFLLALYGAVVATLAYLAINQCNCSDDPLNTSSLSGLRPNDIFSCRKMSVRLENITNNLCDTIDDTCNLTPITTAAPSIIPSPAPSTHPTTNPTGSYFYN
eukprot:326277_1